MLEAPEDPSHDAAALHPRHVRSHHTIQGASAGGFVAYEIISMLCLITVAVLFGLRLRHLKLSKLRSYNITKILVICIYVISILLILSINILQGAVGLESSNTCYDAIYVCVALYMANKAFLYLFLVERAHAARAVYVHQRYRDWVWIAGMVVNLIGLVAILATVFPSTRTNLQGGVCHFAIADKCIWLALAFDIFINFGLTGIFVIALLPALRFQNRLNKITVTRCDLALAPASSTSSTPMDDLKSGTGKFVISSRADATSPERKPKKKERIKRSRLDRLFRKTIIGTCFILVPTVFNLALYTADHGDEPAWLCLTICTLDVTCQVIVTFWLTVDSIEGENESVLASRIAIEGSDHRNTDAVIPAARPNPRRNFDEEDDDDEDIRALEMV